MGFGEPLPSSQKPVQFPTQDPTRPPDATNSKPDSQDGPTLPSSDKRYLEANEKDIKKRVEKLYELAAELKADVDKTDSSKVLSLNLIKKTEEIEKLAREIRNRWKG